MHSWIFFSFASSIAVVAGFPFQFPCGGGRFVKNAACCKWFPVLDDIQENLFSGGTCMEEAHEVHLTFHDAHAGFSLAAEREGRFGGGGADGSILAFADIETSFQANFGLDFTTDAFTPFALKHGVSFGDFVQFAGAVGASNCLGGPRLQFLAGRSNHSQPSPDGLVPEPFDSTDKILARLADIGFSSTEVVDLLSAHSVSAQYEVDTDVAGSPFDSTPDTFDPQFFVETLLKGVAFTGNGEGGEVLSPIPGEFRLQSDWAIARDSRTACEWQALVSNHNLMVSRFEAAMAKLAIVGQNPFFLTDCSDVIPVPRPAQSQAARYPPGKTPADVEVSCHSSPFPSLATMPGQPTAIPPVYVPS
ncbi:lignin peroxidase [Trametopsis cervina]|nr:lignin peroxidase [Trametopsis cervina]